MMGFLCLMDLGEINVTSILKSEVSIFFMKGINTFTQHYNTLIQLIKTDSKGFN